MSASVVREAVRAEDPWPSHSFHAAMRTAQITGLMTAQAILCIVAVASELRVGLGWLVLVHAAVIIVGLVVLASRNLHANWFMGTFFAAMMLDLALTREISEPLAVLAFTAFVPAISIPMILSRRTSRALAGSLVIAVLAGLSIVVFHPDWHWRISATGGAALIAMCLGVAVFISALHRLTDTADRMSLEAAEAQERAATSRRISRAATDGMRLLHDTVVNTLGSIATASPYMFDDRVMRERCREDLTRIEEYLAGIADSGSRAFDWRDRGLLHVVETGMGREELLRYLALLPEGEADALQGCALEALRNATKHSGAREAAFDARIVAHALVLTVADRGRGVLPGSAAAEALAASFRHRTAETEVEVEVVGTGQGTAVRITCPLDAVPEAERVAAGVSTREVIEAMRRRVSWIPATPALFATFVGLGVQPAGFPGVHLAFLITVGLALAVWFASREGRSLPAPVVLLVLAGYPVSALLALAGADLADAAYAFPSMMFTSVPILLHAVVRSWRITSAILLLGGAAVVGRCIAASVIRVPEDAVRVGALFMPVVCGMVIWHIFDVQITRIGGMLAHDRRVAIEARIETAARRAAAAGRERLNAAGLVDALALLRGLAEGRLDPASPDVRARCAAEERHLRHLLALPTDAPHLSWVLATAIARARSLGVELRLQADGASAMEAEVADSFGRVVLAAIAAASPGSGLVVSVIPAQDFPRLFVVGDGLEGWADSVSGIAKPCTATVQRFGNQTIVEVRAAVGAIDRPNRAPAPSAAP